MIDCPLLFEVLIGIEFNFAKTTIVIIFTRPKSLCLAKYASLPLRMLKIKCFYSDFMQINHAAPHLNSFSLRHSSKAVLLEIQV